MNKKSIRVNFSPKLVPLVLKREKFLTWRINDEKNIQEGDELSLWLKGKDENGVLIEGNKEFGKAVVVEVWERQFKDFTDNEKNGHESFKNNEEMINQYKTYYGAWVNEKTQVKIIKFKLSN